MRTRRYASVSLVMRWKLESTEIRVQRMRFIVTLYTSAWVFLWDIGTYKICAKISYGAQLSYSFIKKNIHLLRYAIKNYGPVHGVSILIALLSSECSGESPHMRMLTRAFAARINKIWAATWDFQQCGMCDQQSLRSACAYAQSDQTFC